jgi:NTP pyrophosphatase (non-canonical NTP hydrolase)
MTLREFQRLIEDTYLDKDSARGLFPTFAWLVEEVGELASALRTGSAEELRHEVADCLAWLASVASIAGVDLEDAAGCYSAGCPRCERSPCVCVDAKH